MFEIDTGEGDWYQVHGRVGDQFVTSRVRALNGADALAAVAARYRPKFGKNWRVEYREWWGKNVRLNAKQEVPS